MLPYVITFDRSPSTLAPMNVSESHELTRTTAALRVVLVAENCSLRMGGEAAIPYHYFRLLRARGVEVFLVTHDRCREELERLFPEDTGFILYLRDTRFDQILCRIGERLPERLQMATSGFISSLFTQFRQRERVKALVRERAGCVVHQPIPVSPAMPSLMFGLWVPVVIGPLNGAINYPRNFRARENLLSRLAVSLGRRLSGMMNVLLPGKRNAEVLLVANDRTRQALPRGVRGEVVQIPENGVDLSVWKTAPPREETAQRPVRFIYMGRLVEWKSVDLLLEAWAAYRATATTSTLQIIGDGPQRVKLAEMCDRHGISGSVEFLGWLTHRECSDCLVNADVLVLPSLLECGGAVVLEAMASDLPVIAADWGGPADYLDSSCGLLVPPLSHAAYVESLHEAMAHLERSPGLRKRMGRAGRRKVEELFNWETKVDRILGIYRQLAGIPGVTTAEKILASEP